MLPANAILTISQGRPSTTRPDVEHRERKPIDVFPAPLDDDQGEYSVGIILSGGEGDGTLGIEAMKARRGLTMAQVADGAAPSHPGTPQTATVSGLIDFPLPVQDMGQRLLEFVRRFELSDCLDGADGDPRATERAQEALAEIYQILRSHVGHDFSGYELKTFMRRLHRRTQVAPMVTAGAYAALLRENAKEAVALFWDLLLNVTSFFRDGAAFEVPRSRWYQAVRGQAGPGQPADTSTWLPHRRGGLLPQHPDVRAHGCYRQQAAGADLRHGHRRSGPVGGPNGPLPRGSDGQRLAGATPALLAAGAGQLRGRASPRPAIIRDRSRILPQSLICFGAEVQAQVIPVFRCALRPGGYLFLGTSENVSQLHEPFALPDKKSRVFRSRDTVAPPPSLADRIGGLRPVSADAEPPAGEGSAVEELKSSNRGSAIIL